MRPAGRICVVFSTMSLGAVLLAQGGTGYLVAVGPSPFRFQPTPAATTFLPRKVVVPSPAPADSTPPTIPTPVAVTNTVPPPPVPVMTNEVTSPETSSPSEEVVSPQMLLKYFNRSTNGPGTSVIAPITVPAQPREPVSSHATYSN